MLGNIFKKIKLLVKKGRVNVSKKNFDLLYKFLEKRRYEIWNRKDYMVIGLDKCK